MTLALLKNIGVASAHRLAEVGLETEAQLRDMGPVAAYLRVRHAYPNNTSILLLYALQAGLIDMHWMDLPDEIKDDLKRQVAEAESADFLGAENEKRT